jgi:hypothetical protein
MNNKHLFKSGPPAATSSAPFFIKNKKCQKYIYIFFSGGWTIVTYVTKGIVPIRVGRCAPLGLIIINKFIYQLLLKRGGMVNLRTSRFNKNPFILFSLCHTLLKPCFTRPHEALATLPTGRFVRATSQEGLLSEKSNIKLNSFGACCRDNDFAYAESRSSNNLGLPTSLQSAFDRVAPVKSPLVATHKNQIRTLTNKNIYRVFLNTLSRNAVAAAEVPR